MPFNVDVENIATQLDFDIEDVEMLLEVFLESSKESLEEMNEAIKNDDLTALYQCAHGIKGSAANIILKDISEVAKEIELNAKENNQIDYSSKVNELTTMINSIQG